MDLGEPEEKRTRRKPNFTVQERMHLAQSYAESYDEYNRGFTPTTKGEAKIGRQRLLERWAAELSSFGIVERTPVEVEQKIRDYMKKIAANRKRAVKRVMSPPCQLISSVVSEGSTVDDSTTDDSLIAYAGFLLEQHRAAQNDCTENFEPLRLVSNSCDTGEAKSVANNASVLNFESTKNTRNSCRKRKASSMSSPSSNEKEQPVEMLESNCEVVSPQPEMDKERMDFDPVDLALKTVYVEIARKELEKKTLEVEAMRVNLEIKKVELEGKRHDVEKKRLELRKLRGSVLKRSLRRDSRESSGTSRGITDQFDPETE
uniref:Myb_DNA-bind_5 domain-containing protein n=1 Tax=Elaeophora elaphi TaxID=1147741 RepID=A0A158Q769_9BILA